jgi:hypothetical protein
MGDSLVVVYHDKRHERRWLCGLRALRDEALLRRYVMVSLEPRRRHVDGVQILPWQEFLQELWDGALT